MELFAAASVRKYCLAMFDNGSVESGCRDVDIIGDADIVRCSELGCPSRATYPTIDDSDPCLDKFVRFPFLLE